MAQDLISHTSKKYEYAGLIVVILVACILRFADGGLATSFRYDQARLSQLALEMTSGEAFHFLGIESSAGVPNSPMTVYFLLPFFALSNNPVVVVMFIGLWNVVGVALLWAISRRYFGYSVAMIAGLAYAINPAAVFYSRSIWAQDFHTPIILLAIWCGLSGFLEKRPLAQILCLPLFIIGFQIHFAAWTLLPLYLWFLLVGRKNLIWSCLAISLSLTIVSLIPFWIGLSQQPAGTSDRLDLILSILSDGLQFRWYPVEMVSNLVTGIGLNTPVGDNSGLFSRLFSDSLWNYSGITALIGIVSLLRPGWRKYAVLVLAWALLTLVAFIPIWTGSGVYPHYFIPSIPAFSLLTALGIVTIVDWLKILNNRALSRSIQYGLYGITGLVFISQSMANLQAYQYRIENYIVNNNSGQTATPMKHILAVRDVLQDYDDVILLGANPHESNYYIWEPLLYDTATCVRDLLILDGVIDILPGGSFAVVVAPLNPINANYEVPERYKHDAPIIIPLREGEDPYIVYPFEEAPEWTETPMNEVDADEFDSGARLRGYFLGEGFIRLQWDILQIPDNSYQYFVHFLDENGEKIGQRDVPFYVSQHWCTGDTLITGAFIDLPENTRALRVGMYIINADGGISNSSLVNEAGDFIGDAVSISLIDD